MRVYVASAYEIGLHCDSFLFCWQRVIGRNWLPNKLNLEVFLTWFLFQWKSHFVWLSYQCGHSQCGIPSKYDVYFCMRLSYHYILYLISDFNEYEINNDEFRWQIAIYMSTGLQQKTNTVNLYCFYINTSFSLLICIRTYVSSWHCQLNVNKWWKDVTNDS